MKSKEQQILDNYYKTGMSIEEICIKTSMKKSDVLDIINIYKEETSS